MYPGFDNVVAERSSAAISWKETSVPSGPHVCESIAYLGSLCDSDSSLSVVVLINLIVEWRRDGREIQSVVLWFGGRQG